MTTFATHLQLNVMSSVNAVYISGKYMSSAMDCKVHVKVHDQAPKDDTKSGQSHAL